MEKIDIKSLKEELAKLYNDFKTELPTGNSPQEIDALRKMASHATTSMFTLSLYRRGLEEYIRKREAEIILAHNTAKDVPTPKDQSMKAYINRELAEEKSYFSEIETMIEVSRSRVMLIMSLLKSLGEEKYV